MHGHRRECLGGVMFGAVFQHDVEVDVSEVCRPLAQ